MNRLSRFRRNIGWFGVAQYGLAFLALTLLCLLAALQQEWGDPAFWSPALFFVPALLVRTRNLVFHVSWLQLLTRIGQATVLGLLLLGIIAYQNGGMFMDYMIPAAWFTLGLSFWMLSHPMVYAQRRSLMDAARGLGRSSAN
jgi:hypothetical protein